MIVGKRVGGNIMWEKFKTVVCIFMTVPVGFFLAAVFSYYKVRQLIAVRKGLHLKTSRKPRQSLKQRINDQ